MVIAELKLDMTIVKVLRQVYKQVDSDSLQKLKAVITVVKLRILIIPATMAQHVAHPLFVGEVIGSNLGPTPRHNERR